MKRLSRKQMIQTYHKTFSRLRLIRTPSGLDGRCFRDWDRVAPGALLMDSASDSQPQQVARSKGGPTEVSPPPPPPPLQGKGNYETVQMVKLKRRFLKWPPYVIITTNATSSVMIKRIIWIRFDHFYLNRWRCRRDVGHCKKEGVPGQRNPLLSTHQERRRSRIRSKGPAVRRATYATPLQRICYSMRSFN